LNFKFVTKVENKRFTIVVGKNLDFIGKNAQNWKKLLKNWLKILRLVNGDGTL